MTLASNAEPISPALRVSSNFLFTSSRTCCNNFQKSESEVWVLSSVYHSTENTESARFPGINCQISSAVKLKMGAIHRTKASKIWNNAVWAERRARLSFLAVYKRSLRIYK